MIYLDNAATTSICDAAKKVILDNMDEFYNPNSSYEAAHKIKVKVEEAREKIAELIGAEPEEIYFTSGGSEANSWVTCNGVALVSSIEHASVKPDYIFDVEQTDEEVIFKFKDTSLVADYLEPSTFGAGVKAHSVKNLPKSVNYDIPESELRQYETLVKDVEPLRKGQVIRGYIASLATKRNPASAIQSDMKQKRLKGLAYIHSIGKWDKFITYVKKNV